MPCVAIDATTSIYGMTKGQIKRFRLSIMSKIIGNLYRFDPNKTYDANLELAVKLFKDKFKARPTEIWARVEDAENINGDVYCMNVVPCTRAVMPLHFILWRQVATRSPIKFEGERIPIL
jgi:hypothetical protein